MMKELKRIYEKLGILNKVTENIKTNEVHSGITERVLDVFK